MASSVPKAISRLQAGLAAGDPYEAQQGVKTTYYRLKARRQTHDGYDLLHQAAVAQFGAGQFTCGVELAKLLLEAYKDDGVAATQEAVDRLHAVLVALPAPAARDAASKDAMLHAASAWAEAAIAWAARDNGDSRQLRSLHCAAADWQWNTRDEAALASVSRHYAAALNAEAFFHVLSDGLDPAKAREWDLYVCRAFLLVLASAPARPRAAGYTSAQAHEAATTARATAQAEHCRCAAELLARCDRETSEPEFGGIPGFPLISLCHKLVQLLPPDQLIPARKGAKVLGALRQHYQPALQQDPELGTLLDTVAFMYFGARRPAAAGGMGGMMGGLLQMLGGGGGGLDSIDGRPVQA